MSAKGGECLNPIHFSNHKRGKRISNLEPQDVSKDLYDFKMRPCS